MPVPPPIVPAKPRRRRKRRAPQPSAGPLPPAGANVISVHYDAESEHVIWRFDSIIVTMTGNPLGYLSIAGFVGTDSDGYLDNELYTYFYDQDGNPPGAGDLWSALANDAVQTENGGVLAGSGVMV